MVKLEMVKYISSRESGRVSFIIEQTTTQKLIGTMQTCMRIPYFIIITTIVIIVITYFITITYSIG